MDMREKKIFEGFPPLSFIQNFINNSQKTEQDEPEDHPQSFILTIVMLNATILCNFDDEWKFSLESKIR